MHTGLILYIFPLLRREGEELVVTIDSTVWKCSLLLASVSPPLYWNVRCSRVHQQVIAVVIRQENVVSLLKDDSKRLTAGTVMEQVSRCFDLTFDTGGPL